MATKEIKTVYYIMVDDNKVLVSEDDSDAEVIFEMFVVEEEHDFDDGICENCGKHEDDSCVYFEEVKLEEDGEYVLVLDGEEVDTFTFENVEKNIWTIMNKDGEYVALEDGEIVYTDAEFEWTYDVKNHTFSAKIVNVTVSGGFWGNLFGGSSSNKTTVTIYYLVEVDGELAVSTNKKTATAELLVEVVDEHDYDDVKSYKGFDVYTCEHCAHEKVTIAE